MEKNLFNLQKARHVKDEEEKLLLIVYKIGFETLNRTKCDLLRKMFCLHTGRTMNNYGMVSRLGITEQSNNSESELRIFARNFSLKVSRSVVKTMLQFCCNFACL